MSVVTGGCAAVDRARVPASEWSDARAAVPRGIAIVTEGLNNNLGSTDAVAGLFLERGLHVLRAPLAGNDADVGAASGAAWTASARAAIDRAAAERPGLPVIVFGYSSGALAFLSALCESAPGTPPEVPTRVAGAVYLAPPLELRYPTFLLDLLRPFAALGARGLSLAPRDYRAHAFPSLRGYVAVADARARLGDLGDGCAAWRIPTLALFAAGDELVDTPRSVARVRERRLASWRTVVLEKSDSEKPFPRHLLLDERTAGPSAWRMLTDELDGFLNALPDF